MKKVLFVEDDGLIYNEIRGELGSGFETVRVSSYASAKGRWEREKGMFDCMVLDLQINPLGLEITEIDKYAPLFGMAVLDAVTKEKSIEEITQIRKKIVIYSGYVRELYYMNFEVKNIKIVAKEGNSIKEIAKCIKTICEEL